jgi:hypothetical protein
VTPGEMRAEARIVADFDDASRITATQRRAHAARGFAPANSLRSRCDAPQPTRSATRSVSRIGAPRLATG